MRSLLRQFSSISIPFRRIETPRQLTKRMASLPSSYDGMSARVVALNPDLQFLPLTPL